MAVKFETIPSVLRPSKQLFHLMPMVKFGPVMPDGRQQRTQSAGPHWIAELEYTIATKAEILNGRSIVTKMAGGATEVMIPVRDRRQAPWPAGYDYTSAKPSVVWLGASLGPGQVKNIIIVRVTAAAAAGATRLTVKQWRAGTLIRGQYFSITDSTGRKRLYQISEVPRGMSNGATGTIEFQPPLRSAVAVKTYLDFDNPHCTMTLDDPKSGQMEIGPNYFSSLSITARESFNGF